MTPTSVRHMRMQGMFRQLFPGSKALLLKRPNGVETTTGALVWRNGRAWTVDIITIGDHHNAQCLMSPPQKWLTGQKQKAKAFFKMKGAGRRARGPIGSSKIKRG